MDVPVELEALRIRYRHIASGVLMTVLSGGVIAILGAYQVGLTIAARWFVFHAFVFSARSWRARRVLAAGIDETNMSRLQNALFFEAAISAIVWASTVVFFIDFNKPASVVVTIAFLTAVSAQSSSEEASAPWPFILWTGLTACIVAVRFITAPDLGYELFALAAVVYGIVMLLTCLQQARVLRKSLKLRFENRELVAELREQKLAAEQARHVAESASLAKSQFLAAASHDLRQPLYALSLFSTSLGELRLDADGRKVVGKIQESIAAMESLFVGLLDVSRLDAGVVQARLETVSIDALFDRLSQYFRPIAVERGLDLRFRSDGEWVTSDETLLEQVMSNLVSNALRNTKSGAVLIAARKRRGKIRLEVWDTGIGIGEADRQRIFDEFVQLNNPERDRRMGLGLGLSIAQRSAALIGGKIELFSRLGRGSRFCLTQPAAVVPNIVVSQAMEPAWNGLKRALSKDLPILIVDDDRDVRAALSDLLGRWGLRFDLAANAAEALVHIETGKRYGLVLADYRLPGALNGLELIASITRRQPMTPPAFALITGDFNPDLISAAHAQGVPLFHKPLKPEKLRSLLGLSEPALAF